MADWFAWNGTRCTEYGIHVIEHPPETVPAERVTFVNVPGRSGSLTKPEGEDIYDDLLLTVKCFLDHASQIPAIAGWLKGSGTVTFGNHPGEYYQARVVNQIPFEHIFQGRAQRTFSVTFRCQPFRYMANAAPITVATSGTFIDNPGSVASEPVITISGTGDVTLLVGMSEVGLSGLTGAIILDTPLMEAYDESRISRNTMMDGAFPVLRPGANAISWVGNVSSVVIQPNWRSL